MNSEERQKLIKQLPQSEKVVDSTPCRQVVVAKPSRQGTVFRLMRFPGINSWPCRLGGHIGVPARARMTNWRQGSWSLKVCSVTRAIWSGSRIARIASLWFVGPMAKAERPMKPTRSKEFPGAGQT